MTKDQIRLVKNSEFAGMLLEFLLEQQPDNMKLVEQAANWDIKFARWCDRNKVWTGSRWRELTRVKELKEVTI